MVFVPIDQEATMPTAALRVPSQVLRWILVLGPILVLALALQSLWALRVAAAHPDPDEMSVVADRVAQLVDAYLKRIAGTTSNLAVVPEVVQLAAIRSSRPSIAAEDALVDQLWRETAPGATGDPFAKLKDTPVSVFFRDLTATEGGIYREIFLADSKGRLVAASNRTEDYIQNDRGDSWWPANLKNFQDPCRRVPLDCVKITNVEWDPSAAALGYDVVLPVVMPGRGAVGVIKAVVDPHELGALLDLAMLNDRFDVALIDTEGVRLLSRKPFFAENRKTSARLRALPAGAETSLPLAGPGEEGPVAFVRRLSLPHEGRWSIAVADRGQGDAEVWKASVLWFVFTLGMLAIAAGAFAVKLPASDEAPAERRAGA
jgi:hypothetical protein